MTAHALTAQDHQSVFVVTRAHKDDPFGRCTVLVKPDNEYYQVNKYLLASLEAGMSPADLDLDPIEDEEEML